LLRAAEKAGIRLKVVGTGSLYEKYIAATYKNIEFLGYKSAMNFQGDQQASFVIVPSSGMKTTHSPFSAYSHGKVGYRIKIGGIQRSLRRADRVSFEQLTSPS
jgi:hypothetical protein